MLAHSRSAPTPTLSEMPMHSFVTLEYSSQVLPFVGKYMSIEKCASVAKPLTLEVIEEYNTKRVCITHKIATHKTTQRTQRALPSFVKFEEKDDKIIYSLSFNFCVGGINDCKLAKPHIKNDGKAHEIVWSNGTVWYTRVQVFVLL